MLIIQPKVFLIWEKVQLIQSTLPPVSNTSWVQYVSPNVNVLYGNAWLKMGKGPLVLTIPPIPNRYYVMQFMDPFGQVFAYVGARATGNTGGTFLIAGPNRNGIVPNGMHEIKTPTNIAWISIGYL